jgi:hypothetical protein
VSSRRRFQSKHLQKTEEHRSLIIPDQNIIPHYSLLFLLNSFINTRPYILYLLVYLGHISAWKIAMYVECKNKLIRIEVKCRPWHGGRERVLRLSIHFLVGFQLSKDSCCCLAPPGAILRNSNPCWNLLNPNRLAQSIVTSPKTKLLELYSLSEEAF